MLRRVPFLVMLLLFSMQAFAGTGRIIILNLDSANVGLNDPTPAAPVGGNAGTTLGQQRLNVYLAAAEKWQNVIDTNVDIRVRASFAPISGCTDTEGVLGQASPIDWAFNFDNAPKPNVWYPIALANKFANRDLLPTADDINVRFNSSVDNATCLGATNWYYGLDGNHGIHQDLFVVVLHELGHGLGIAGAGGTPNFRDNLPAIADTHTFDLTTGLRWDQMTLEQRQVSQLNTGNLVWDGAAVRGAAGTFLKATTALAVSSPSPIAGSYDIGTAAFGPVASSSNVAGRIAIAADEMNADGPTSTDGCTPFTNASSIAGRIALIDRGSCTFVAKARNAQAAGAIGVVIADNTRTTCAPPGMAGVAPDVTIPIVSITQGDGDTLKTVLNAVNGTVQASLRLDPSQLAGTKQGYVRLYAPCTFEPGSSIRHWDTNADPDLLMEPSISSSLLHGLDLTLHQLLDLGWSLPPRTGRRVLKR